MMNPLLKAGLERVVGRRRRLQLSCKLAGGWTVAAFFGLGLMLLERQIGWSSSLVLPVVAVLGILAAIVIALRHRRAELDWRRVASEIEAHHPELAGRLLTAVQQRIQPGSELNYLQERLVQETLLHGRQRDWAEVIPKSRLRIARAAHLLALVLFGIVLWGLRTTGGHGLLARIADSGITVSPGDTSIERGNSLVVLARFGGALPVSVDLVIDHAPETGRRIPLTKSLADPMFGGSVPEVTTNLVYHVEYSGQRTRDFQVTVFEFPRLERADADVTFPDYTGQAPKHIKDTRRLSAVEGSRLHLTLALNKPVFSARLIAKDDDKTTIALSIETNRAVAELKQFVFEASKAYELQLVDAEGRTNKTPARFVFDVLKNRSPELKLASPRGDVRPSALEEISFEGTVWDDFGMQAYGLAYTVAGQETKLVELGHAVPAKEKRPFQHLLRLEDLGVQPDSLVSWFVWADDVGPDGQVRRVSGDLYFAEVRPFEEIYREGQAMDGQGQSGQQGNQTARLAELQKQIINATWKLQREHGRDSPPAKRAVPAPRKPENGDSPSGALRRQTPAGGYSGERYSGRVPAITLPQVVGQRAQPDPAAPTSKGGDAARRTTPDHSLDTRYESDVKVVLDSMAQALEQAEAVLERQQDPRAAVLWKDATQEMEKALQRMKAAIGSPAALPEVLAAEQAAYQALLKLQQHEYQVLRSRNRSRNGQGGSSREQQMQLQLEQMDLTQSEDRYETQRQAQSPQDGQRREQLQVMNRLQELARRQQDLNDRLKELQTALREARNEQEREEIQRRLKRLQEEEQQMLADLDELRQRMERPENQSRMAEERRQLDQTRTEMQRAAEAAGQAATSQALASGTRAQRQLQELRDQMRKENSSQFANDLRELRADARELARQQDDISKKMQADTRNQPKSLSDSDDRKEVLDQLSRQKERMTNVLDRATQVSQDAEAAEPLLSRQLYDTVRKFSQDSAKGVQDTQDELLERGLLTRSLYERLKRTPDQDGAKLLELTSELLRQDFLPQAKDTGQRVRSSLEDLKRGVERAAESVLGDDTEALRLAQQELDRLTDQLQREAAQSEPGNAATNQSEESAARSATGQSPGERATSAQQGEPAGESTQPAGAEQAGQSAESSRNGEQARASQTGRNESARSDTAGDGASRVGERNAAPSGGDGGYSRGGARLDLDRILDVDRRAPGGPITGENFMPWSDRLRDVEEMIDAPDLRNGVAAARERARLMRQEFKRELKKPDWAVVRLQVIKPLVEVRDRISEELARRQSTDALVPIDRDPVPSRYSELVRRYYEQLGKDK